MIVPSVRAQSRVPGFEEKSLVVIGFETNDLDVFKVHVVAEMVDMACKFWSKPAAAFLCSAIRVFNDLSVWPY